MHDRQWCVAGEGNVGRMRATSSRAPAPRPSGTRVGHMMPDLRALEEEGDLGVGRVREHVEEAALDGSERGHGCKILGQ